jgi:hypothetical protein
MVRLLQFDAIGTRMSQQSTAATPVTLDDRECAVVRCAIDYFLDEGVEYTGHTREDVEDPLSRHRRSTTGDGVIHVLAGMDDLYQSMFREYARALQEQVSEEEGTEEMGQFFESVFKSVVMKLKAVGGQTGY